MAFKIHIRSSGGKSNHSDTCPPLLLQSLLRGGFQKKGGENRWWNFTPKKLVVLWHLLFIGGMGWQGSLMSELAMWLTMSAHVVVDMKPPSPFPVLNSLFDIPILLFSQLVVWGQWSALDLKHVTVSSRDNKPQYVHTPYAWHDSVTLR